MQKDSLTPAPHVETVAELVKVSLHINASYSVILPGCPLGGLAEQRTEFFQTVEHMVSRGYVYFAGRLLIQLLPRKRTRTLINNARGSPVNGWNPLDLKSNWLPRIRELCCQMNRGFRSIAGKCR